MVMAAGAIGIVIVSLGVIVVMRVALGVGVIVGMPKALGVGIIVAMSVALSMGVIVSMPVAGIEVVVILAAPDLMVMISVFLMTLPAARIIAGAAPVRACGE
jgi:hypothetical protein